MSEVALLIDDLRSSSSSSPASTIPICRICHEEEFESCKSLETPCACSGTVKFAHRDCVQRWCDEKGNTICEICLQNFEPGYISPTKKTQLIDATITIRGSLVVPINDEEENPGETLVTGHSECSSADERVACWRSVALICTALLLFRHLYAVFTGEEGPYPFSLATVIVVKASGILLPMYILFRVIAALHNNIRCHYESPDNDTSSSDDEDENDEENEEHHDIETQA